MKKRLKYRKKEICTKRKNLTNETLSLTDSDTIFMKQKQDAINKKF